MNHKVENGINNKQRIMNKYFLISYSQCCKVNLSIHSTDIHQEIDIVEVKSMVRVKIW